MAVAEKEAKQAPAPSIDIDALAGLITKTVEDAMAPLKEELRVLKQSQPQMRASDTMLSYQAAQKDRKYQVDGQQHGEQAPIGLNGQPLDVVKLAYNVQRFQPGDRVMLNLDFRKAGMKPNAEGVPMSWGELLAEHTGMRCSNRIGANREKRCQGVFSAGESCPHCGQGPVITKYYGMEEETGWHVYKVRVPGLTNNPTGMAFMNR